MKPVSEQEMDSASDAEFEAKVEAWVGKRNECWANGFVILALGYDEEGSQVRVRYISSKMNENWLAYEGMVMNEYGQVLAEISKQANDA